jgi:hypothetical protein
MNNETTTSIRQAISREDYSRALKLWDSYASDVSEAVQRGELTRDEMDTASDLFAWSTAILRGARAHLQVQLNMIHSAAAYLPRPGTSGIIRTSL